MATAALLSCTLELHCTLGGEVMPVILIPKLRKVTVAYHSRINACIRAKTRLLWGVNRGFELGLELGPIWGWGEGLGRDEDIACRCSEVAQNGVAITDS